MKINHILAVLLIASAGQAVASSALTKFSPHVSRTALLATAAGHKRMHPIYVQKRNLSERTLAIGCAWQTVLIPAFSGSIVYAQTGNAGFALSAVLAAGIASYKVNMGIGELMDAKNEKIEGLEQQLAAQNKNTELRNKNKRR